MLFIVYLFNHSKYSKYKGKLKKKKKIAIKENLPIQDKTLETKKLKFEQTELEVKTSDKEEESKYQPI